VAADALRGRTPAAALDAAPPRRATLDESDPAAPPRKNGELVFAEVWESRVFGLTMALHAAGAFEWEEFRQRLIGEIAAWERQHERREAEWSYYACWLRAFEDLLADKNLCRTAAVDVRVRELAARPQGHDH